MRKAVILAPFWRRPGHVGNSRVDRFVRWLAEDGYQVVIVRAGSRNERHETVWGMELTVRDPLGINRDPVTEGNASAPRKPNRFLYWLAYWLFNPDPSIVWARMAAANRGVQAAVADADFILSSSPPESAHVGAWMLAKKLNLSHVVDMRDGWLDEPLKPILVNSGLRRWMEARLESKIIANAARVFVTSNNWYDLLCRRLPLASGKTVVLTNGYPNVANPGPARLNQADAENHLVLVHAGRFSGSRRTQEPILILAPLLNALRKRNTKGVIRLIGALHEEEIVEIAKYNGHFEAVGWRIECPGAMERDRLLEVLPKASGLLLLSASHAAIPSKLFEYVVARRPILAVTEKGSATWQMCESLPQACLVELRGDLSGATVGRFLDLAAISDAVGACPVEYSEQMLARKFLNSIDSV